MEILPPWATALKVSLGHIQSWMREGAPAYALLEWCLDHGKIKETEYLIWAKEYYSLPVVKTDFFEQPVPEDLFNQKKSAYWKDSLFPVAEWDGVLFVACLEPPPARPIIEPLQYLLVPRSLQKIWWQAMNKPAATVADLPVLVTEKKTSLPETFSEDSSFELTFELEDSVSDVPVPPVAEIPTASASEETSFTGITLTAETVGAEVKIEHNPPPEISDAPVEVTEIPMGLNFSAEDTSTSFKKRDEFTLSEFLKENPDENTVTVTPPTDVPLGLNLELGPSVAPQDFSLEALTPNPPTNATEKTSVGSLSLQLPADEAASAPAMKPLPPIVAPPPPPPLMVTPPPPAPLTPPSIAMPPPPPTGLAPLTPPGPPPMTTMAPPPLPSSMTPPSISVTPPPPPGPIQSAPPPRMATVETIRPPVPAGTRVGAPMQHVNNSFQKMREHFEQCMVLVYKDEQLVPQQWDDMWILSNNAPPVIDLSTPSIFKIVVDTKGPYHGYVAPSPVNDAFFTSWNKGRYPEHVTIIPLLLNNEVIGMLLATSSRVRGSMVALNTYQALGVDLARQMAS
jgi:hypothetical protein